MDARPQALRQAQETKVADDYRAAGKALANALAQPDAAAQAASAGQCRYELAWSHYRADEFEPAAEQFEKASLLLKAAGSADAVNSAWMAYVAYKSLAEKSPRFLAMAEDALQAIKRDFPGHEYAKKADYHIAQLRRSKAAPEETIRELKKIRPKDASYLASRYDLCVAINELWSEAPSAGAKAAAFQQLREAVDEYFRVLTTGDHRSNRLRVLSFVAAAALKSDPVDRTLAEDYLARAEPLAAALPDTDSAKAEYHFRRMQAATPRRTKPADCYMPGGSSSTLREQRSKPRHSWKCAEIWIGGSSRPRKWNALRCTRKPTALTCAWSRNWATGPKRKGEEKRPHRRSAGGGTCLCDGSLRRRGPPRVGRAGHRPQKRQVFAAGGFSELSRAAIPPCLGPVARFGAGQTSRERRMVRSNVL